MNLRAKRWISRLLLVLVAFAQASAAFADCWAERARLSHALAAEPMEGCSDMTMFTTSGPQNPNRCLAHCTADLQIPAAQAALVRAAADAPVLLLPRPSAAQFRQSGLESPAPGTPPPRILQHSFLI